MPAIIMLTLLAVVVAAQTPPALLPPFNQSEFEPAKREKALAATQEYQTREAELKADTAMPGNEKQKQRDLNYWSYLKKMEGLLSKQEREKARTALVENDVKALRAKPAMPRHYDELGLNEEQTAKAQDLNLQQRIRLRTVYHSGNYSPTDRADENKYLNEEFAKKFNALLTPEQRTALEEMKKRDAVLAKITLPPLYQKLGLNQSQSDKLKLILLELQTKIDTLNKDQSLTADARGQQIRATNADADARAMALLTKDQKPKLEDLGREANYQMPPFYAQLGLDEQQQAKLKETLLWQAREASLLRQDAKLTPEQKQQAATKLNDGVRARLKSFLTPEQMTKLETLMKEKR
ncbi:MAG TPA: hypothetical protein PKC13_27665 [Blastocatellia bacterium]|nr:hypothetical protein [Blastocatellia bacterium]